MNANDLPLGLFYDMSNADYHAEPAIGSTGLRKAAKSPLHYKASLGRVSEPTAAMKSGTLAHCAVLEPGALPLRYRVRPDGLDGRTKEGKAWLASVPADVEAVTAEQWAAAQLQNEAVRDLPEVAALLATGRPEVSAFWVDGDTGLFCKCRPDWVHTLPDGSVILLDLKTTQDASPEGFPKSIGRYGYHMQAAWYSDGFEKAGGRKVRGFVFVAVESEFPHAAAAYMLDDESMEKGRSECRRLLALIAECSAANTWPGYAPQIELLSLPRWAA